MNTLLPLATVILLYFVASISGEVCSGNLDYDCGEGTPRCIPSAWKCDNIRDCSNGKDEEGCNFIFCPANTFKCQSRECLPTNTRCNGTRECHDGSDEAYCFLTISPTVNEQRRFTDEDDSTGPEVTLTQSDVPTARHFHHQGHYQHPKPNPAPNSAGCLTEMPAVLNFTGTYQDDTEGQRHFVAVDLGSGVRKVYTLEEAFEKDAWSLCQYIAAKLK
ncbi:low-density lipoprotein receptor domain class A domain-containing protein [Ditylenchus destructor]|nr:low-density lipoprotein receptor domain class A domain-containing protein [Ditylenchus destructor]